MAAQLHLTRRRVGEQPITHALEKAEDPNMRACAPLRLDGIGRKYQRIHGGEAYPKKQVMISDMHIHHLRVYTSQVEQSHISHNHQPQRCRAEWQMIEPRPALFSHCHSHQSTVCHFWWRRASRQPRCPLHVCPPPPGRALSGREATMNRFGVWENQGE